MFDDDNARNDSGSTTVTVQEKPAEPDEFTFSGRVAARAESRHTVSVPAPAIMYVNLAWHDWEDLRLRIYDPSGVMVAEVDSSTWWSPVEEIAIDVGPGDWTVAVRSDSRRRSVNYTADVIVTYQTGLQ
jgi:hypothetical protein